MVYFLIGRQLLNCLEFSRQKSGQNQAPTGMLQVPALGPICRCLQFAMLGQWKHLRLVFWALILSTVSRSISNLIIMGRFECYLSSFSFSKATPFGVWGPEKDRNVCVFVVVSFTLSPLRFVWLGACPSA